MLYLNDDPKNYYDIIPNKEDITIVFYTNINNQKTDLMKVFESLVDNSLNKPLILRKITNIDENTKTVEVNNEVANSNDILKKIITTKEQLIQQYKNYVLKLVYNSKINKDEWRLVFS